MEIKKSDIKKGDEIWIQIVAREQILEETFHLVSEDEKGLFVMKKGFKLYIHQISSTNRIIKLK